MLTLVAPPLPGTLERDVWIQHHLQKQQPQKIWVESPAGRRELERLGFSGAVEFCNEHTAFSELEQYAHSLKKESAWLLTDGGAPVFSDPGAQLVALCHLNGIKVQTLGIHSFALAGLVLSGCPGQQVDFWGYLPKSPEERERALVEQIQKRKERTLVILETPYRVHHVLQDLVKLFPEKAWLTVAENLGTNEERVSWGTIQQWKAELLARLPKKPLGVIVCYAGENWPYKL